MPCFVVPSSWFSESNDCHTPGGSPAGGQFCSGPGAKRARTGRLRGSYDYRIVFRSQIGKKTAKGEWVGSYAGWPPYIRPELGLTAEETRRLKSAKVVLTFRGYATAQLGAPIRWTAPNGVRVIYVRGQRRDDRTGVGTYHDFNAQGDEAVVPLTRNVGPGRRALRAWAAQFMGHKITTRFQARQLVRPGD